MATVSVSGAAVNLREYATEKEIWGAIRGFSWAGGGIARKRKMARTAVRSWGVRRGQIGAAADALLREADRIARIQAGRAARRGWSPVGATSPRARAEAFLLRKAAEEVRRRGLGTRFLPAPRTIVDWEAASSGGSAAVIALLRAEGWEKYGTRHFPRAAAWLAGYGDGGWWAVRVPTRIGSVAEAVEWLKPPAVKAAEAAGRWVGRQGDVYLVEVGGETGETDDLRALIGTRHAWDPASRTCWHPEHSPLVVPSEVAAVAAYPQRTVDSGGIVAAVD